MVDNRVQQRIDQSIGQKPQIKPEEQKLFLGTFKERVVAAATIKEAQQLAGKNFLIQRIEQFPALQLLINAQLPANVQQQYMQLAQQKKIHFKLVDTTTDETNSMGFVYAGKEALHLSSITLTQNQSKTPNVKPKTPQITNMKTKSSSIWQKIFNKQNK